MLELIFFAVFGTICLVGYLGHILIKENEKLNKKLDLILADKKWNEEF